MGGRGGAGVRHVASNKNLIEAVFSMLSWSPPQINHISLNFCECGFFFVTSLQTTFITFASQKIQSIEIINNSGEMRVKISCKNWFQLINLAFCVWERWPVAAIDTSQTIAATAECWEIEQDSCALSLMPRNKWSQRFSVLHKIFFPWEIWREKENRKHHT